MKADFTVNDAMILAVFAQAGVSARVVSVSDAKKALDAQQDRLIKTAEYAKPLFLTEELVGLEIARILCESGLLSEAEKERVNKQCLVF